MSVFWLTFRAKRQLLLILLSVFQHHSFPCLASVWGNSQPRSWEHSTPRPHRVWKDYITTYSTLAASHRCCLESPAILLLPGLKHPSHYSQDSNNLSFSGCALRSPHPSPSSPQGDAHSDWVVITIAFSSEASPRLSMQILLWKAPRPWEPGKAWLLQERYLDLPHTTTH